MNMTYKELIDKYIKNEDLKNTLYSHTGDKRLYRDVKWGLYNISYRYRKDLASGMIFMFNYEKTKEGSDFWNLFLRYIKRNPDIIIYEWKPVKEWMNELSKKNINILDEYNKKIISEYPDHPPIMQMKVAGIAMLGIIMQYYIEQIGYISDEEDDMLKFMIRYNRMPNDFDNFNDFGGL